MLLHYLRRLIKLLLVGLRWLLMQLLVVILLLLLLHDLFLLLLIFLLLLPLSVQSLQIEAD